MTTTVGGAIGAPQQPVSDGILSTVLGLLRRRRAVIVTVLLGTLTAAVLAVTLRPPGYKATAVLQVQTATTGSLDNLSFDLYYTDRLISTYLELAGSERILDEVVGRLGVDGGFELDISTPANTELLVAEATSGDPELALRAADSYATLLAEEIRNDLGQRFDTATKSIELRLEEVNQRIEAERAGNGDAGLLDDLLSERDALISGSETLSQLGQASVSGVSIVQPAGMPTARAISPMLLVAAAGVLGLLGGYAVALVVDRLDPTVFDIEQAITERGHRVLGEVADRSVRGDPASVEFAPLEPQAVRVAFALREASVESLLFTSPFTSSSTSVVVADVTRALASTGNGLDVVAVDAAFEPMLHAALGTPDRPGLHEALLHEKPLAELALPARHPRVHLVPGGSGNGARSKLIDAFWVVKELRSLSGVFDLVVVHAPPLLGSADASLLAGSVDGTVLIVENVRLHKADLEEALAQATALPSAFLGVVIANPGRQRKRLRRQRRPRS